MIAEELGPIQEECERLQQERDGPDRDEAEARAQVLQDAPSARLFLRYHAEARLSFQKAYSELVKALERDKAAHAAPAAAAPTVAPNEPRGVAGAESSTPRDGRGGTGAFCPSHPES